MTMKKASQIAGAAPSALGLSLSLQFGGQLSLERIRMDSTRAEEPTGFERELENALRQDSAAFMMRLALLDPSAVLSPTLRFFQAFTSEFPRRMLLHPEVESKRHRCRVPLEPNEIARFLESAPPMAGSEYLDESALNRYWGELHRFFYDSVSDFAGSVEDWFNSYTKSGREIGRIHFHLVENPRGELPFAFLATYGSKVADKGRTRHLPLRQAVDEFRDQPRKMMDVLISIRRAEAESPWLQKIVASGEVFQPLSWTPAQAQRFLQDVEVFEAAGILCRIPDWWKSARQGAKVRVQVGEKSSGHMGFSALLDFRPELVLGGEVLSEAELRTLAEAGESLALLKGKWVAVDPEKIREALELFKRAKKLSKGEKISLADALKLLSGEGGKAIPGIDLEEAEIAPGQWLRDVLEKMRDPSLVRSVAAGAGFRGTLRPYQQLGINWLNFLHELGFGACLADDMGLGKTVQVLAFLSALKAREPGKSLEVLLVTPASLIFNWQNEFARFAPGLRVRVAHASLGENLTAAPKRAKGEAQADVILTTYAMVDRLEWLGEQEWSLSILDEAQAIKNPLSKQTRAIKGLRASRRIALTGTPIENGLSDLWSLFDFLNPGMLGAMDEFRKFTSRLQDHPDGYGRLRRVVQPYILRRLKSDKSLIPDLPDKVEMKTYAALSRRQVALYRELVRKFEALLRDAEGIQRHGLIFAFLIKFKQVCNHPDHYTGSGAFVESESGKFALLRELCQPILEKRERALIFTQFTEITEPLAEFLEGIFGRPGLILTGKTPVAKRRSLVETFQGEAYVPFMILSLKAGGTGLNLTRANHVIHFDRWWNPAVENQATDRAFRLGQQKNVLVHKLISRGTLEEKIDALIESKVALARDVIKSGNEDWITDMNDKQLLELFTIGTLED